MKKIITTTVTSLASVTILTLASCVAQNSTDPVGDGFTNASNAIGNVVNRVVTPPPANPTPNNKSQSRSTNMSTPPNPDRTQY